MKKFFTNLYFNYICAIVFNAIFIGGFFTEFFTYNEIIFGEVTKIPVSLFSGVQSIFQGINPFMLSSIYGWTAVFELILFILPCIIMLFAIIMLCLNLFKVKINIKFLSAIEWVFTILIIIEFLVLLTTLTLLLILLVPANIVHLSTGFYMCFTCAALAMFCCPRKILNYISLTLFLVIGSIVTVLIIFIFEISKDALKKQSIKNQQKKHNIN